MFNTETDTVLADNGIQSFMGCDVEEIAMMSVDRFINENGNVEYRYDRWEICDNFDISIEELERIKSTYFSM